jgi:syntaxin 16
MQPPLPQEQGMTMEQLEAVDDMEVQVAKRDHEINSIVESIEELSQIFKELAVLVIDQGTVLDRIDYNMEQVSGWLV